MFIFWLFHVLSVLLSYREECNRSPWLALEWNYYKHTSLSSLLFSLRASRSSPLCCWLQFIKLSDSLSTILNFELCIFKFQRSFRSMLHMSVGYNMQVHLFKWSFIYDCIKQFGLKDLDLEWLFSAAKSSFSKILQSSPSPWFISWQCW